MTNKEASIILKNTASTLKDGIKYLKESHQKQFKEAYEMAIKDLEQTQWIPIKFRPITEEEKQWHEDWYDGADVLECPLPEDGQEVLITYCGETEMDTFINDGIECYFENRDISDVEAWMPLPKSYKSQKSEDKE